MVKKLLSCGLISLFVLNSCDRNENALNIDKETQQKISNKAGKNVQAFMVKVNADPMNKCNGYEESVSLNSNYSYYDDYVILPYDYESSSYGFYNGKPITTLSKFLAEKGAHDIANANKNDNSGQKLAVFIGSGEFSAFLIYNPTSFGSLQEESFTISSETYGYFFTGAPGGYMPNDAANTVLHEFKQRIAQLPSGGINGTLRPKIRAVYYQSESYLCIPPSREIKMSIKYSY